METGLLIKDLRIKKGMTQEELADKTELSSRTIQRIENGEVDPRAYTLQMIAKALEVDYSIFTENKSDEDNAFKNDSDRHWLALIHLSGLLPLFFLSFIIWKRKKADINEMTVHYRAAIALQSIAFLIFLFSLWVYYWSEKPIVIVGVLLINGILSVRNTLNVLNGKPYILYGPFRDKKQ